MDENVDIGSVTSAARSASRVLAGASPARKNAALEAIASALVERAGEILAGNASDMERGRANGMAEGLLDRLELTSERLGAIAASVREVAALPDPVGEEIGRAHV